MIFTAALLAVCLAGCAPALTPQEYCDSLLDEFHSYRDAMEGISTSASDGTFDTSSIEYARAALDHMAALSPPGEYADLHQELCESMETEREWITAAEDLLKTAKDDPTNAEKLWEIHERLEKLSSDSKFPSTILEVVKTLKDDLDS